MDSLDANVKVEEVCRTCLTDDGHFFNINDIFDHYTLTQMIQNITNLQMNPSDGYTQSICFQCVKEVRRANQFRIKCLESNDTLVKLDTKTLEVPINVCEMEPARDERIKKEREDNCDISDCYLETGDNYKSEAPDPDVESDCESNEELCIERIKQDNESSNNLKSIFDCPLCHALFYKENIYQKHISEYHPDRLKDNCFNQNREPLGHVLREKILNKIKYSYKCILDEFIGNSFIEFQNHIKEHMGDKPIICAECGFRTTQLPLLKRHRLQIHVEEKRFSCSLCSYTCQRLSKLKSHSAVHTLEKNYQCKLCPMKFRFPSALSVHKMREHDKRKSHVCSICQKSYYRSIELREHMNTHTGERPHICYHCGMSFIRAENMRTHVKLQHEVKKTITVILYKCDLCDYSTKTKHCLKLHMMKHNGEKPFKCPECPASFLKKYHMNTHMMRHTGQKNFACNMCDHKTITNSALKQHKRIHTGEKPYSCTICDYRGNSSSTFKKHMQTHSSELNFECPNCPYKTNVKACLTRHIKKNCVIKKKGRCPTNLTNILDGIL